METPKPERNELDEILPLSPPNRMRALTALWQIMANEGVGRRLASGSLEPGDWLPETMWKEPMPPAGGR